MFNYSSCQISKIDCQRDVVLGTTGSFKSNTLNTINDNDFVFQRDDVEIFKLDKFTENTVEKEAVICSKQLTGNGNVLVKLH